MPHPVGHNYLSAHLTSNWPPWFSLHLSRPVTELHQSHPVALTFLLQLRRIAVDPHEYQKHYVLVVTLSPLHPLEIHLTRCHVRR